MRQLVARVHAPTARVLDIVDRLRVLTATFAVLRAGDVAGYALLAATFMAMGPTSRRGVLDVWSSAVGFAFALYAAWWSAVQVHEAWRFGDLSPGLLPFPLWVPPSFMALRFIAFTGAMLEGLLARLAGAPAADRPAAAPDAATPPLERGAE